MVAVDVFAGVLEGLVLAEIDRGDGADRPLPEGLRAVVEVSTDECFTGGSLARTSRAGLQTLLAAHGISVR